MGKHISHIKSNLTLETYVNKETGAVVSADYYNNVLSSDEQSKYELTVSPKLPTPEQLANGEIAINYADGYETISLKNNTGGIVTFKTEGYNTAKYATNEYIQTNLGDIIVNKDALNGLADNSEDLLKLTEGDSAEELAAMANAEGANGVLTKSTDGATGEVTWTISNFAGTDTTVVKVGDDEIESDNTGNAPIKLQGDTNLSVSANTATKEISVGVAAGSSLETLIGNATALNSLADESTDILKLTEGDSADELAAMAGATGDNGVLVKKTEGGQVTWEVKNFAGTDKTVLKVGNVTIDSDNTGSTPIEIEGDSNLSVVGDSGTDKITVGVAVNSDLASLITNTTNLTTLASKANELENLAENSEDLTDLAGKVDQLDGLVSVSDVLEGIGAATGDNGVLVKTSDGQTTSWAYTNQLYDQGTAQDLNTGTDTSGKVWSANTLSEFVAESSASATKFKNGFNATTGAIDGGSDTLTSIAEVVGDMYTVTAAGTFAGKNMEVGDSIVFKNAVAAGTAPTENDFVFIQGTVSVTNTGNTLDWNTDVTVATVEGVNITAKLPANPNTDTKVTSVANHYTPTGTETKSASGATGTAGATVQVVTGVTVDAKGHVTGVVSGAATDTTYTSKTAASGGTDVSLVTTGEKYTWNNKQTKVSTLGSTTKPVYASAAGTFAACDNYAGGTAVTLNGDNKAAATANFYAPTTAGTSGQILASSGNGAPTWTSLSASNLPSNLVYSTLGTDTQVTSVPVTYGVVEARISSSPSQSIGLKNTSTVTVGSSIHLIVFNTGSSDVTLTIPHNPDAASGVFKYYNTVEMKTGANVVIPAGGVAEINFLFGSITSGVQNVYIRYA